MKVKSPSLTNILLIIIVAITIIVASYLRKNFARDTIEQQNIILDTDSPDMVMEPFTRTHYDSDGKTTYSIKADKIKAFLGKKAFVLEQIRKAVFWQKDGSYYVASAKKGIYYEASNDISLEGSVKISAYEPKHPKQPTLFKAEDIKYSDKSSLFQTDGNISVIGPDFNGNGRGLRINRDSEEAHILNKVVTTFPYSKSKNSKPIPMTITSNSMDYYKNDSYIHYFGQVHLISGENNITGDELNLRLDKEKNTIDLIGNVNAKFLIPKKNVDNNIPELSILNLKTSRLLINRISRRFNAFGNVVLTYQNRKLTAKNLVIFYAADETTLVAFEASGNVRLKENLRILSANKIMYSAESDRLIASGRPELKTPTERIKAYYFIFYPQKHFYTMKGNVQGKFFPEKKHENNTFFDRKSQITTTAKRKLVVKPTIQNKKSLGEKPDKKQPILFSSHKGEFNELQNIAFLEGNVMVRQGTSILYANNIMVNLNDNHEISKIEADGEVRANSENRNIKCEHLDYSGNTRQAILSGNCRAWEEKSFIEAPNMIVYTEKEILDAKEKIKTHLENLSSDRALTNKNTDSRNKFLFFKGNPVDITSNSLLFDNIKGSFRYYENVKVTHSGNSNTRGEITGKTLELIIDKKSQEINELNIEGNVKINQPIEGGMRYITGDRAIYRKKDDILSVEGTKVTINDPQNNVECSRAYFHIKDEVYIIEGLPSKTSYYPEGKSTLDNDNKQKQKNKATSDLNTTFSNPASSNTNNSHQKPYNRRK